MTLTEVGSGILETSITWTDLEQEIQKKFGSSAKFGENRSVKRIGEDCGFASKMALIDPDWQEAAPGLPKLLLAKLPKSSSVTAISKLLTNIEIHAYGILGKYGSHAIKIPEIYCAVPFTEANPSKGYIVMEYMSDIEFRHFCDDLSYEQVKQVLPSLIAIQSITEQLTDEERNKCPKNIFTDIFHPWLTEEVMSNYLKELAVLENGYFADLTEDLSLLIAKLFQPKYLKVMDQLSKFIGAEEVLQHGDVWAANLLWKNDHTLAALIDFQILSPGCCGLDILKLLLHMEGEERRQKYKQILAEFYEGVKVQFKGAVPYTLEQLELSYELLAPVISIILCFGTRTYIKMAREHRGEESIAPLLLKTRMIFEDALEMFRKHETLMKNWTSNINL